MEKLIDYIKNARRMGFRDDAIKKKLLESGEPELKIDDAFLGAGKPKRQNFRTRARSHNHLQDKVSHTILLDKWLKDALEKKAEADGLTLYNEVKKILVESVGVPKGVSKARLIRKKMTEEEKKKHRLVDWKYKGRVLRERRKKRRIVRRKAREERRKERKKG